MNANHSRLTKGFEFRESSQYFGGILQTRNALLGSFRHLGPPDVCHMIRADGKQQPQSDERSYFHFIVGVDCSSSATIAAYINSLHYAAAGTSTNLPSSSSSGGGWFGGSTASSANTNGGKPVTTLKAATYCTWNAFSRQDVRVEIRIPGGVEAYALFAVPGAPVESSLVRMRMTDELWMETCVSAVLRCLAAERDNPITRAMNWSNKQVQGTALQLQISTALSVNILNPFPAGLVDERRFLDLCNQLFDKGWRLGNQFGYEAVSLADNFMSVILHNYFEETFRFKSASGLFERHLQKDLELATLVSSNQARSDQEIAAIRTLYQSITTLPDPSAPLLKSQAEFMWRQKGRADLAMRLYHYTIETNPADAKAWLDLAELYFERKEYDKALCLLNSVPMIAPANEPDFQFWSMGGLYTNLSELFTQMPEPEARTSPLNESAVVPEELVRELQMFGGAKGSGSNARLTPEALTLLTTEPLTFFGYVTRQQDACDASLFRLRGHTLFGYSYEAYRLLVRMASQLTWDGLLELRSRQFVMEEQYRRVAQVATEGGNNDASNNKGDPNRVQSSVPSPESQSQKTRRRGSSRITVTMFEEKRVCERWFDELFMILFEDLRVYTAFQREAVAMQQTEKLDQRAFTRSPLEWELLGDLCVRLQRFPEAAVCYTFYSQLRYNCRVLLKLLAALLDDLRPERDIAANSVDPREILQVCDRLICAFDRWKYGELKNPGSPIVNALAVLNSRFGAEKIRVIIMSMKFDKRNEGLLFKLMDYLKSIQENESS